VFNNCEQTLTYVGIFYHTNLCNLQGSIIDWVFVGHTFSIINLLSGSIKRGGVPTGMYNCWEEFYSVSLFSYMNTNKIYFLMWSFTDIWSLKSHAIGILITY